MKEKMMYNWGESEMLRVATVLLENSKKGWTFNTCNGRWRSYSN